MPTQGPTCVTHAKAHLPGCLWGQGLLLVQVTPEIKDRGARTYGGVLPAANNPGRVLPPLGLSCPFCRM